MEGGRVSHCWTEVSEVENKDGESNSRKPVKSRVMKISNPHFMIILWFSLIYPYIHYTFCTWNEFVAHLSLQGPWRLAVVLMCCQAVAYVRAWCIISSRAKQSHLFVLLTSVLETISRHMALCGTHFNSPEMEQGAESAHYDPSIAASLALCLSMCHVTSHIFRPSVARALHHLLGLLVHSNPSLLYSIGVQPCAMRGQEIVAGDCCSCPRDEESISNITWGSLWMEKLQALGRHCLPSTPHGS